ncbi:MAG: DUF1501 domain-containing protein [Rhodospirillales bacterium]|nr:DUF1501 domain-containing protein [Rhodospirillales bacterium]
MITAPPSFRLTRRAALLGLGGAVALGPASLALAAAPTDRRLVVILLRGALDGLSAVVPYGDHALATWRTALLTGRPGQPGGPLDLGGFYGLHPALGGMHTLYAAGELLPVHAIAGAWRVRSHFEAQDFLEMGDGDQRIDSGWLNRVAGALPRPVHGDNAIAIGATVPLILRGQAHAGSWLPENFRPPATSLYEQIAALNRHDPVTGPALADGLRERGFIASMQGDGRGPGRFAFAALARVAGRMLAAADGPRLAAMELGGWDTHVAQVARLRYPLTQLDQGLIALKQGLGAAWAHTAVLAVTEFGRTVRENGTGGTDHGTATVAFLAGGAVAGGKVRADWPGLAQHRLFENRDLAPTAELRALCKGVLAQHLGLDQAALLRVFPGSGGVTAMAGLIRPDA